MLWNRIEKQRKRPPFFKFGLAKEMLTLFEILFGGRICGNHILTISVEKQRKCSPLQGWRQSHSMVGRQSMKSFLRFCSPFTRSTAEATQGKFRMRFGLQIQHLDFRIQTWQENKIRLCRRPARGDSAAGLDRKSGPSPKASLKRTLHPAGFRWNRRYVV